MTTGGGSLASFCVGVIPVVATTLALGASAIVLGEIGVPRSFAAHMASHAVVMNVLAPTLCLVMRLRIDSAGAPFLAGVLQLLLLGVWHVPAAMALHNHATHAAMHVSLAIAACLFWASILGKADSAPWAAIAALLITGKIVCLAGAILLFSPRVLSAAATSLDQPSVVLADQQLGGLVMLAACPLAYMTAAAVLFCRWLSFGKPRSRAPA